MPANLPELQRPPVLPGQSKGSNSPPAPPDGVSFQCSQVTPAAISDGLTNTFFAGEKYLNPNYYLNGMDIGDDNSLTDGFDHDVVRWGPQRVRPTAPLLRTLPCATRPAFVPLAPTCLASAHPAGVTFVFCDGSVKLISYTINTTVYMNLCCRNDGQNSDNY